MALMRKPEDPSPPRRSAQDAMPPALASLGLRREAAAGEVLFREGEGAECCYLLESGEVALRRVSRRGEEVEIARIVPGEWFGEVVLFAARDYPARAVAVRDSVAIEFKRSALRFASEPEAASFFLSLLARKCLALNRRIDQLTVMDARERLASYILGQCPRAGAGARSDCDGCGSACVFALPAKKREIALELGMVPETLSRTFRQMEAEGLFKVRGSRIEIPSCAALRELLED